MQRHRLPALARDMRKRVNQAFEVESESGPLHNMLLTFIIKGWFYMSNVALNLLIFQENVLLIMFETLFEKLICYNQACNLA